MKNLSYLLSLKTQLQTSLIHSPIGKLLSLYYIRNVTSCCTSIVFMNKQHFHSSFRIIISYFVFIANKHELANY